MQAGPGQAVVVSGLRAIPAAGDELIVVGSEARAAKMAAARSARAEDFRQGQLARMQAEHSRRQQQLRKQEYERCVGFCCWVVCKCCAAGLRSVEGCSSSAVVGVELSQITLSVAGGLCVHACHADRHVLRTSGRGS
jgi:hypothetical protein